MTNTHGGEVGARSHLRQWCAIAHNLYGDVSRTPWKVIGILVLLTMLFSAIIVRDFVNPVVGRHDAEIWLFQANYFAKHTHFTPLPSIEFETNDVLYPYGANNVFRSWHFESSYFYAACYSLFGHGPWLQWYYVGSIFLCGIMVYFVVRAEFGARWALLAAIALSFGNYYCVGRYPLHYTYAITHWMTLSLLLDLILVRRVARDAAIPLHLLLLKAVAQTWCFGLDLAYLCGFTLTSTLICATWCLVIVAWRRGTLWSRWKDFAVNRWRDLRTDLFRHPWANAGLALAMLLAAFLYVPLVFGVFLESRKFAEAVSAATPNFPIGAGRWQIFIPVLPMFCPDEVSRTVTRNLYLFRPGLFFSGGAVLAILSGLWRRRVGCVVFPMALLVGVMLTMDLEVMQWVRCLPWFEHARQPDRLNAALPVSLFSLILLIPRRVWRSDRGKALLAVGLSLFVVEMGTAYWLYHRYGYKNHTRALKPDFYQFAEVVARSPGEAVLEWPFMVKGGSHLGNREFDIYMCPLVCQQSFQPFHQKKIIGTYFGRLFPELVKPLLDAGWQWLLLPDHPHSFWVRKQHRDFTEEEWQFIDQVFRKNDFCGIILYTDLLPSETVKGFHKRFGQPVATAEAPFAGEMQFIRKPKAWRSQVDPVAGRKLVFRPPALGLERVSEISFADGEGEAYLKSSWSDAEPTGRWSVNEAAELAFSLPERSGGQLTLHLELRPFQGQEFRVSVNGLFVCHEKTPADEVRTYRVVVPADRLSDVNLLRFHTRHAQSPFGLGIGSDRRQLGVQLKSLRVSYPQTAAAAKTLTQSR